ncbi:polymeric immunoglobulin receptor-like [Pyxicephalus adspersus]|uniref:polymeric immunoglobulin receptor-like n=1 Tax=Pyxicephalus adspersus TaxID=30357 RepID=UPI003B5A3B9D
MMAAILSDLIAWSLLIQVASGYLFGPKQVTGPLGGSVTVSCYYDPIPANIHSRKYWCKEQRADCYTVVSTTPYVNQKYGNQSLQDFRNHFTINITNLQQKDTGIYRCGIGNKNNFHYYVVNVTISQGKKVPSSSEVLIGKLRDSLVIHCPAPQTLHNESLYWCKLSNTKFAVCDTIINSSGQVNSRFWGRVLIQKERNTTGFNVLVNDLRMTDSGFYHCGVRVLLEDSEWKDVYLFILNGKSP